MVIMTSIYNGHTDVTDESNSKWMTTKQLYKIVLNKYLLLWRKKNIFLNRQLPGKNKMHKHEFKWLWLVEVRKTMFINILQICVHLYHTRTCTLLWWLKDPQMNLTQALKSLGQLWVVFLQFSFHGSYYQSFHSHIHTHAHIAWGLDITIPIWNTFTTRRMNTYDYIGALYYSIVISERLEYQTLSNWTELL